MENREKDCISILTDCGLGTLATQTVVKNIVQLEEFYSVTEIIELYNYILENIRDCELITEIIRLSDSYKSKSTLNILVKLLSTKNINDNDRDDIINMRALCARAISNYKDYSTVTPLLTCLNNKNEDYKVRLACADALGRIGDKYAVEPLINVVSDENEKSVYLKETATFALGILGDTSAIDPLVSILESKQGFWDKFSFLKEKIVEALGRLNFNNKNIMKALKHSLLDSSPMVRINAIEAIMNSGDECSIELIRPSLNDVDFDVQKNALIALYNLCGKDVLEEVMELPIYAENLKDYAKELMNEYEEDDYE